MRLTVSAIAYRGATEITRELFESVQEALDAARPLCEVENATRVVIAPVGQDWNAISVLVHMGGGAYRWAADE